jgi:hypothetical protein
LKVSRVLWLGGRLVLRFQAFHEAEFVPEKMLKGSMNARVGRRVASVVSFSACLGGK